MRMSSFRLALLPATLLLPHSAAFPADVVIAGAGIAGLSAALEAGRRGLDVTVVDMWSVFGGHAVVATGGLSIVDTPLQRAKGVRDSPEIAYRDFMQWGEDADKDWVRYYVNNSNREVYEWLTSMGVVFSGPGQPEGNSVPRTHSPAGYGLGLVSPIYRECLKLPNITFVWNTRVTGLLQRGGKVAGVQGQNLRTGKPVTLEATSVILATGGFQSNLELVRTHWPANLRFPERLLAGSGVNSQGAGLAVAQSAGAALRYMDHQWNYGNAIPDPRHPGTNRGVVIRIPGAIWINHQGKRFANELEGPKTSLPALLRQRPASCWAIFDQPKRQRVSVAGTNERDTAFTQQLIFSRPELYHTAPTLAALAKKINIAPEVLQSTVERYNAMAQAGQDADFHRAFQSPAAARGGAPSISAGPFYAIQLFPLARKSMGGISVDLRCRVLDAKGNVISGLYAAGEVTGFGGINGKAGLEGTFLAPSLAMGRVAGREVPGPARPAPAAPPPSLSPAKTTAPANSVCLTCHNLDRLLANPRPGYTHFENAHRAALERKEACSACHAEMGAGYNRSTHKINRLAQTHTCGSCHFRGAVE